VKLFFFENQQKIFGQKTELLTLETVALAIWVPLSVTGLCAACHPCIAQRDGVQIQKLVAKVLNKESRAAAEKGWLCSFGVGREDHTQHAVT
jgi:hypothetical protein